jgi:hypothetical protein
MLGDKQKTAALILSKMDGEGGGPPVADEVEPTGDEGLNAAASDILSAVESKDPAALTSALRAAFDLMGSAPEQADPGLFAGEE